VALVALELEHNLVLLELLLLPVVGVTVVLLVDLPLEVPEAQGGLMEVQALAVVPEAQTQEVITVL
jgi:hypothetical protein